MSKKQNIARRFIVFSCFSVILILLVTGTVGAALCYYQLAEKQQAISRLILQFLSEKTNETLVSVEKMINHLLKLPDVTAMVSEAGNRNNPYLKTLQKMQVEKQLASVLLHSRNIDGVVLQIDDAVMTASNSSLLNLYQFSYGDALNEIGRLYSAGSTQRYYLYTYHQGKTEFDCVVYPLAHKGRSAGTLTIILNRDYAQKLDLLTENVLLSDGSVSQSQPSAEVASAPLNWEGWSVSYRWTNTALQEELNRSLLHWLLLCAGMIVITWGAASLYMRWCFKPLQEMARIVHKIRLNDLAIQHRRFRQHGTIRYMLYGFFGFVVLSSVLVSFAFLQNEARVITDELIGSELQIGSRLMAKQISSILYEKQNVMRSIVAEDGVQSYMNPQTEQNPKLLEQWMIRFLSENNDILNLALYDTEGTLLYTSSYREALLEQTGASDDIAFLQQSPVSVLYRAGRERLFNDPSIRFGLSVVNINPSKTFKNLWGYLLMDWNVEKLLTSLNQYRMDVSLEISLLDAQGCNLSTGQLADTVYQNGITRQRTSSGDYCIVSQSLEQDGWVLLLRMPWNEYVWKTNRFVYTLALLSMLMLLLGAVYSAVTIRWLTKDIHSLLGVLGEDVRYNSFGARFRGNAKTQEISILATGFNHMMDELEHALQDKLSSELSAKDAEIHARELELNLLQQQIKPHFLYNSLRTIQYMIILGDSSAARMVELLITLFRTGINAENMMITIGEEIEHVTAYIEIEKIRFRNQFDVQFNVEESLLQEPMLKLLLQPLVENAINHGIREGNDFGHIFIFGQRFGKRIRFEVRDDGVGIPAEKLHVLQKELASETSHASVGIFNVHERIQLRYGAEYGLTIESTYGQGTRVLVEFPSLHS